MDTSQSTDQQALALTHAIALQESGDNGKPNYNAVGDNGTSKGAYQWQPGNFESAAKAAGLDPTDFSPENQDKVAYSEVKGYKDKGYDPGQIASLWNSGSPNNWQNHSGTTTINGKQISYDTPAYVKGVQKYYNQLTGSSGQNQPTDQTQTIAPTPSSTPDSTSPSVGGFLTNVVTSGANVIGGLGNAVLHPVKTLENLGNTAVGAVENTSNLTGLTKFNNNQTQTASNVGQYFANKYGGNSIGQIGQNILKSAYNDPVGTALDASTVLDGVGGGIGAIGKIADASKAADLAEGSDFVSTANGIAKSTSPEGLAALTNPGLLTKIGSGLKTAADYSNPITPIAKGIVGTAKGLAGLTDSIPRRIMNNLLPQLKNSNTIDYAINNTKLGSVDSMVNTSQKALDSYNSQIQGVLKHPDYAGTTIDGSDIAEKTLQQFPNSEYDAPTIFSKIKSMIPGSAKLLTKLQNGSLSLEDANTLRQAIDKVTYKTVIDSPEIRAGKELASAFGNSLRSTVQTVAPETAPIFEGYSKEINLQKALGKLSAKASKAGVLNMKDLIGTLGATGLTGPIGGAITLGAEKLASSPLFKLGLAKTIKGIGPAAQGLAGAVANSTPLINAAGVSGRLNQASQ